MKKLFVIIAILALALTACSNADSDAGNNDEEVLRVGMELKYPPFETVDSEGNPMGVSIEMAKALGEYLGREVEIIDTPYASLIPSLETGKIDIIISSMTINEERMKKVDFSDPYTTSQLMMLVYKDSKVQSWEDLNDPDVIIASKTGTIGALWAAANAPDAQIKNIDEEATAVLEVSQGNADVFIYDPLSIVNHHNNYPDSTRAVLEALPNTKGWGIAMQKNQEDLRNDINEFLKKAKEDGTFDEIREKFLNDKIKEFEENGLDFFF
jgi:polar amino acid transport system substrate-binding protein